MCTLHKIFHLLLEHTKEVHTPSTVIAVLHNFWCYIVSFFSGAKSLIKFGQKQAQIHTNNMQLQIKCGKVYFSFVSFIFYFYVFFSVTVAAPYPKTSIKQIFENRKSIKSDIFIPATTSKYPIKEHIDRIDAENCEEKPIGFVTEWISTYIFLESKCVIYCRKKG